jgi:hypothetical protein
MNYYKVGNINTKQDLLHLTLILEEQIQNVNAINYISNSCTNNTSSINDQFDCLIEFYSRWELSSKTDKHLAISFHQQILNSPMKPARLPLNRFEAFEDLEQIMLDILITKNDPPPSQNPDSTILKPLWNNDTSVTELSDNNIN